MPNGNSNSISWTSTEFEKLVELVKPHPFLYNVQDPSRKNILARESTWELIARELSKPVEECKKRWRALRDGYMKTSRLGNWNNPKIGLFKNLEFLREAELPDEKDDEEPEPDNDLLVERIKDDGDQQVITDNQEYYEITLVDNPQDEKDAFLPKILIPQLQTGEPPKKIGRKNCGRKKYVPAPVNLQPIKILPKPVNIMNGPKLIQYVEDKSKVQKQPAQTQRSEVLDSLIEKVLKEHTNEIDVFFRSMAASVKKLQPNLIPKVKMEVCNVIAKYEMQNFDKNANSF